MATSSNTTIAWSRKKRDLENARDKQLIAIQEAKKKLAMARTELDIHRKNKKSK
jgi:hypothetical protein